MRNMYILCNLFVASLLLLKGCASELDAVKKRNRPAAKSGNAVQVADTSDPSAPDVDWSHIVFQNLNDGSEVNLQGYLDENNLDHVLLIWGSKGCTSCTEKNKKIRDEYMSSAVFQPDSGVAMVAVNTDPAKNRPLIRSYKKKNGFDFMKFSDPSGALMVGHFLPEGDFALPFIAMVSRKGILWYYTNKAKIHVDEVMNRANGLARSGSLTPVKPRSGAKPSTDAIAPTVAVANNSAGLGKPSADRFADVEFTTCEGDTADISDKLESDIVIFHIEKEPCDIGKCPSKQLHRIASGCSSQGKTCNIIHSVAAEGADCPESVLRGGEEFYEVFATRFNGNAQRQAKLDSDGDLERVEIPEVSGPLTMAFDKDGRLLYGTEGEVKTHEILSAIEENKAAEHLGPQFEFYHPGMNTDDNVTLSEIVSQADYTVVNVFGNGCSSCAAELKHWSAPGELLDFCEKSGGKCQVLALDEAYPDDLSATEYHKVMTQGGTLFGFMEVDGTEAQGIRVPVIVDPVSSENFGINRFFQGYLAGQLPHWNGFGTVVYDREGKIIAEFSGDHGSEDPVFAKIKKLVAEENK